jgi:hypothetical protein
MVKAEWGTKRSCPKCGTRFYDLGKEDPVTCIECGVAWDPEPVLKSKQPLPFDAPKKRPPSTRRKTPILLPTSSRSMKMPRRIRTMKSIWAATTISAWPGAGDDDEEV